MLKNMLLLFTFLFILSSCSPKNESSSVNSNNINSSYENLITFEPISGGVNSSGVITLKNSSGDPIGLPLMALELEAGEVGRQEISIRNTERRSSSPLNISYTEEAGYSIQNGCPSTLGRKQACSLVVEIDATSLSDGNIASQIITINEVDYNFEYNIVASSQPTPEEQATSFLEITPDLANLDFGNLDIDKEESSQVTIQIKNTSRETLPVTIDNSLLQDISYTTTCGTSLRRRGACSIYLNLNASNKSPKSVAESLIVSGKNYGLLGELTQLSKSEITQQELAKLEITPLSLDLGTLDNSEFKEGTISVTNISNVDANLEIDQSSLSDFSVSSTTCPSILKRKLTCDINIKIDGTVSSIGTKNENLIILGESHSLTAEIIEKVIPLDEEIVDLNLSELTDDNGTKVMDLSLINQIKMSNNNRTDREFSFDFNSPASELSINDSCNGIAPRKSQCIIEFNYTGIDTNFSHEIIVNSITYRIIDSSVVAPTIVACTLTDASNNGWNITNANSASGDVTNGDVSNCVVSSCNSGFDVDSLNKLCIEAQTVATIEGFSPLENTINYSKTNTDTVGLFYGEHTATSYDIYRNADCSGSPYSTGNTISDFGSATLTSSVASPINLTESFSILAKADGLDSTCYGNNVVIFDTTIPILTSDIPDGGAIPENTEFNITGTCDYNDIKYIVDNNITGGGRNQFTVSISEESDGTGYSGGGYILTDIGGSIGFEDIYNPGTVNPISNYINLDDGNETCSFSFPITLHSGFLTNISDPNVYLYFRVFDRVGNKVEFANSVEIGGTSSPTIGNVYFLTTAGLRKRSVDLTNDSSISYTLLDSNHKDDINPNGTFQNSMAEHDGYVYYSALKNGSQLDRALFRVNTQTDVVELAKDFFAPTNTNGGWVGEMMSCGGELFISANSDVYGHELWRYNNGAYNVFNMRSGAGGISPAHMSCINNTLYFLGSATSGSALTLYKYENGVDSNILSLGVVSYDGSSSWDQMIYVENENKFYIIAINSGAPQVGTFNLSTNQFSFISSKSFSQSYPWIPTGMGTDGTNVYVYENGYYGATNFGTPLYNRVMNYTTESSTYDTLYLSNFSPTYIHYNNNYLFWSDSEYQNQNDSNSSLFNLTTSQRTDLYSAEGYEINQFLNYGEYSIYALDEGGSSSLIRMFNTSTNNHISIGYGSRFIMVYP